jgi:hypothetical protein
MRIIVRQRDGQELAHITDAELVPRVGDEVVLYASSDYYRASWRVARVIVTTDPDQAWPSKEKNSHVIKSIVVEVDPVQ